MEIIRTQITYRRQWANDELAEHNYYVEMLNLQIQLSQEGRAVYELDTNEINNDIPAFYKRFNND